MICIGNNGNICISAGHVIGVAKTSSECNVFEIPYNETYGNYMFNDGLRSLGYLAHVDRRLDIASARLLDQYRQPPMSEPFVYNDAEDAWIPPVGADVYKYGCATGLTHGKVVKVQKNHSIMIASTVVGPFAIITDSGSLVFGYDDES